MMKTLEVAIHFISSQGTFKSAVYVSPYFCMRYKVPEIQTIAFQMVARHPLHLPLYANVL